MDITVEFIDSFAIIVPTKYGMFGGNREKYIAVIVMDHTIITVTIIFILKFSENYSLQANKNAIATPPKIHQSILSVHEILQNDSSAISKFDKSIKNIFIRELMAY